MTTETETQPTVTPAAEPITSAPSKPGFGKRLLRAFGRFLKALIKVLLVLVVLAGVGYITFLIVQELQRSFNVVSNRVDYNLEQTLEIGHDLGELEQKVINENSAQEARLTSLEAYIDTTLAENLAEQHTMLDQQEMMLAELTIQLNGLMTDTQSLDGRVIALNDGVIALQGDINNNNTHLDELGGELDAIALENSNLSTEVTGLQDSIDTLPLDDINQMRQVVTLFRVWEMITRARLHLLENNAGLAAADTAQALAAMETIANSDMTNPDLLPQLDLIQARLTLANANLPLNASQAGLDLEGAWAELDATLADMLGLELVEVDTAVFEQEQTDEETILPTATPESDS